MARKRTPKKLAKMPNAKRRRAGRNKSQKSLELTNYLLESHPEFGK